MNHLLCQIWLYNVDGSPNEIGKITEAIDLVVQYKGHKSQSRFYILSIGHKAIVLGNTWLAEHNPDIDWQCYDLNHELQSRASAHWPTPSLGLEARPWGGGTVTNHSTDS